MFANGTYLSEGWKYQLIIYQGVLITLLDQLAEDVGKLIETFTTGSPHPYIKGHLLANTFGSRFEPGWRTQKSLYTAHRTRSCAEIFFVQTGFQWSCSGFAPRRRSSPIIARRLFISNEKVKTVYCLYVIIALKHSNMYSHFIQEKL
jgi:hypothetical protein